ncbi:MAG TPA: hypothetical protein PLI06_06620 [Methanofastidiosum sp.]|nr:hypothetical protein [Methanofastidiosum sp.]HNU60920.1 hypothetical protein [Methanofastidiosum sp.]HOI77267.1 hypothetical protein [Methanofastidiosum sp.]
MKKIFAILISLLFVASVFGVASLTAEFKEEATATPERVKVGQIITVTSNLDPCDAVDECYDPTVKIYDTSMTTWMLNVDFEEFQDASKYVTKLSGPIKKDGEYLWIWTYRANFAGTIVFGAPAYPASPPTMRLLTNPVTITSNSLPMDKFMKFFGFGKKK